ncbi:MAG: hypothetical protein IJ223_00530 [Clostridia bacterium]|nr:hypothetical protein [Clostridia bacterium]
MNKKLLIKIGTIALVLLAVVFITTVSATSIIEKVKPETGTSIAKTTQSTAKTVVGIISTVAIGIAIVMLIYLAIKYMISSPEARAEYKQTAIKYFIGVLIIFTASTLANIIADIVTNVTAKI